MAVLLTNYEQAFENWLIDNHVQYVVVDQQKRRIFARSRIKSFDFLLYPASSQPVIAEVKGRKFKGKSLAGLTGLECWVTMEDIRGLIRWEDVFAEGFEALFIFAYEFVRVLPRRLSLRTNLRTLLLRPMAGKFMISRKTNICFMLSSSMITESL
jgi:hypothetical protein